MNNSFQLLQLTDTHLLGEKSAIYRDWDVQASLCTVIDHIVESGRKADAILLTGDLSQDESAESYRLLRQKIRRLDAPIWALPGNHDNPATLEACLEPECCLGHVDIPGWRIILLNSQVPGETGGSLPDAEMARLEACLKGTRQACLVAIHHPAWRISSTWLDRIGLHNGKAVLDLLSGFNQARILLSGHVHQISDRMHQHIHLLSTPSTCRQFLPGSENFTEDAQPPGYRWIELFSDGRYQTVVERVPRARQLGYKKEVSS